jgi:ubiquinone/menaquinone biosynthesis C-methylase UbiE
LVSKAELYDGAYGNYSLEIYRQIRVETYGEDFGQTSWVTNQESDEIPKLLELAPASSVLEIGCGAGRYAILLAERIGCRVHGLDINQRGIRAAKGIAQAAGLEQIVHLDTCDVSKGLPCEDGTFDAVFSNDAICHIPHRPRLFREIFRVLKTGGRMLFSDALVVGGMLSHEEIATRSSIGYYVFSPPGENESLIKDAGFELVNVNDTTQAASHISKPWFEARQRRKAELVTLEGEEAFEGLQRFLACVHTLTSERRLRRYLYLAAKKT